MCSTTSYTVLEGLVVSATVRPASRTTDGVSKARRAVDAPTRTWFRSQGSPRGRLGRGCTRSDGQGQQENNFRVCPNPGGHARGCLDTPPPTGHTTTTTRSRGSARPHTDGAREAQPTRACQYRSLDRRYQWEREEPSWDGPPPGNRSSAAAPLLPDGSGQRGQPLLGVRADDLRLGRGPQHALGQLRQIRLGGLHRTTVTEYLQPAAGQLRQMDLLGAGD